MKSGRWPSHGKCRHMRQKTVMISDVDYRSKHDQASALPVLVTALDNAIPKVHVRYFSRWWNLISNWMERLFRKFYGCMYRAANEFVARTAAVITIYWPRNGIYSR